MTTINIDKEELKRYLQQLRPEVAENLKIVTPGDMNNGVVYHIAQSRQKEMFPFISKRQAPSEDNTVPRVHVCASLIGCFRGYATMVETSLSTAPIASKEDKRKGEHKSFVDYKGGYYIHELQTPVALAPSKKLVPDVESSEELWLVTYNELTKSYPSKVIGKLILCEIQFVPEAGQYPHITTKYAIEVSSIGGLKLDKRKFLGKGYWMVETVNDKLVKHYAIEKEKFNEIKEFSANLLDRRDELPSFLKW